METFVSCISFVVLAIAAAMRLNILYSKHSTKWHYTEAVGLVMVFAGCVTAIGEWFLPTGSDLHAETMWALGAAIWSVGVSRGLQLCQLAARLQGWDGTERRTVERPPRRDLASVDPFLNRRWRE